MLYMKNTTTRQVLRVTLTGLEDRARELTLSLRSTVGNRDEYTAPWEDGVYEKGYLRGTVKLPAGLPDGEYEYRLAQGGATVASGVCRVGEYAPVPVQNGIMSITFNQYEGTR